MVDDVLLISLVLILLADRVIRLIHSRTDTKVDDKYVEVSDALYSIAPFVFSIVEELASNGVVYKPKKLEVYLNILRSVLGDKIDRDKAKKIADILAKVQKYRNGADK